MRFKRLDTRTPLGPGNPFPAGSLNSAFAELEELRALAGLPAPEQPLAGGSGGSTLQRAILCEDLPGHTFGANLTTTVATVRCLLLERGDGGVLTCDLEQAFTSAEPGLGVKNELSNDVCGDQLVTDGGLRITRPIMENNQVDGDPDESAAVTISGAGCQPSSTVSIKWPGSVGTVTGVSVESNGTWTETQSLSSAGLTRGPIVIEAWEVDLTGFEEKPRVAVVTFQNGFADVSGTTTFAQDRASFEPLWTPDLTAASDTGGSSSDNLTANQTPTVRCYRETALQAHEPYAARLYADGVLVAESDTTGLGWTDEGNGRSYIDLTTTTLADDAVHHLTYTLASYDEVNAEAIELPFESGHSEPLEITVQTSASGGEITATTEWAADGDSDDAQLTVKTDATFVVVNPTADPDPSPPASGLVDNTSPGINVNADDPVTLSWTGSEWEILLEETYGRECLLDTGQSPPVIVEVAPCRVELPPEIVNRLNTE